MKNLLLSCCLLLFFCKGIAQTPKDCAVEVWATVQSTPPSITLSWLASATTTNYSVARKLKTSNNWTILASTLGGTTTQYVDNTVSVATSYEYRIIRSGTNYTGYGYINSGIELPEVDNRGKLILLITDTHSLSLAPEITRFEEDLEGDGWTVLKSYVSPTLAVTQVKAQIVTAYNLDPSNTKALFLLGHIPVPYSGNLAPDGHVPDHQGAWPADVYYGELNGNWTDGVVNNSSGQPARTKNIPGDGKFDQLLLPSAMELQVGRVDLSGMTSFSLTETQLLKNYLDKDHGYRKKVFSVNNAAVIDDTWGYLQGEAFAASGFKNFSVLVTPTNVVSADYMTSMTGGAGFQWSMGSGAGTYTSCGGVGTTTNLATSNLQGIFTLLFGSYFADWDVNDNFLRAPLCQGKTLTSVWSGRPHWAFHHMGMGENIGYSTYVTQNNASTYFYNYGNTFVHIALMGDPTLRNNIMSPVSNVVATKSGYDCLITWSASTETNVIGYNVYMKNDTNTTYQKINVSPVTSTSFTDVCLAYKGIYKYMVRSLKLEVTPSGSYYNMSEGIADTAYNSDNMRVSALFTNTLSGTSLSVTSISNNASTYLWDFGNGQTASGINASTIYTANGDYVVGLIASNPCSTDTLYQVISVSEVGLPELTSSFNLKLWPNPSNGKLKIDYRSIEPAQLIIYSAEGKKVMVLNDVKSNDDLNLSFLSKGVYLVQVRLLNKVENRKIVIE